MISNVDVCRSIKILPFPTFCKYLRSVYLFPDYIQHLFNFVTHIVIYGILIFCTLMVPFLYGVRSKNTYNIKPHVHDKKRKKTFTLLVLTEVDNLVKFKGLFNLLSINIHYLCCHRMIQQWCFLSFENQQYCSIVHYNFHGFTHVYGFTSKVSLPPLY